jgi:hypothetical protein
MTLKRRHRAQIRDYRPGDRAAVRRIFFDTALLGDSIEPQYSDFESYADMFTSYYTDAEPENAFVAEIDGKVVGYVLGCLDSRKAYNPLLIGLAHGIRRGLCFRPGTARFYFRALWDMVVDIPSPGRPDFDFNRFPSHAHCNIAAGSRGGGLGEELVYHLFDRLRTKGSPGLHGEGFTNTLAGKTTSRHGYTCSGAPYPAPGIRGPQGERMMIQLMLRDLSTWEPGAWRERRQSPEDIARQTRSTGPDRLAACP